MGRKNKPVDNLKYIHTHMTLPAMTLKEWGVKLELSPYALRHRKNYGILIPLPNEKDIVE